MIERDDEDMWFECLAFADEVFVPKKYVGDRLARCMNVADRLFARCKESTKKKPNEKRDPQATVVQLK